MPDLWNPENTEGTAIEVDLPQNNQTARPLDAHRGIIWLVVGHAALGLVGICFSDIYRSGITLRVAAFVGLVSAQTSLLGIWGALGACSWWKRLIGVTTGTVGLEIVLETGLRQAYFELLIVVVVATSCVLVPLLIVRCFRVVIHHDSSSAPAVVRIQFSIRHLMILTFVVAFLASLARMVQPIESRSDVFVGILQLAGLLGLVGVLAVWIMFATKWPVLHGLGLVAVAAGAGCWFGWRVFGDVETMTTAVAVEAMAVVVSLLVVRSYGYRLVRLPSRHEANKRTGGVIVHRDTCSE
jgi:hypothetical protein